MPLSDQLKYKIAGHRDDVSPESADYRKTAKWHAERVGGLKNASLKRMGQNLYHAELIERARPGHRDSQYEEHEADDHDFAFR